MLLMWFVVSTDGQKPNVGNMKLFPVHTNNDISVLLTPGQVGCVNGVAEKLPTGVSPCLPCTSKPLYCCAPCPVSRTEKRERLDRSLSAAYLLFACRHTNTGASRLQTHSYCGSHISTLAHSHIRKITNSPGNCKNF